MHGREHVEENVSNYYLTHEVKGVYLGMMIAVPAATWEQFRKMSIARLAAALKALAGTARMQAYQRHPRGPKKPRPERTHY